MKIKEILPFTIESPVIHLVQPSPAIPLGHEVVFQQGSSNGGGVNAIYALAAQEKKARRRRIRQERENKVEEESNLSCGFISPPIHQATNEKNKRKTCFYDLRNNRSMSVAVENITPKLSPTLSTRSKSLDESPKPERRKKGMDFEDILRDLGCSSRTSEAGESTTSKASSGESELNGKHDIATRKCSVASSDSVFYDICLDDPNIENSNTSPPVDVTPRKSFSEETFDKNRNSMQKQRGKILENMRTKWRTISSDSCDESYEEMWSSLKPNDRRRVSQMVDDLLLEIYGEKGMRPARRRSCTGIMRERSPAVEDWHYDSLYEDNTCCTEYTSGSEGFRLAYLQKKRVTELATMVRSLQADVKRLGGRLVKQLVRRDCLVAKRDWHCNWITAYLQANSEKRSEDTKTRFSVAPAPGDSGFTQWQNGMRMVARLPEGIPSQFRKTLWLNLAEKHLASRGVQWPQVEEFCFNEFTNPDDEELGVQIVKDVHRTGCSLFCGVSGKDNQALLKRVLLAYARWNKAVGYCQGFNMLAALILQVMDKSEADSVKVMIYLIEGVLPESYFANNLRGLSVDMAVFRDLLRIKLPALSRHFDQLQCDSKDSGTSYEPPLTNVFTMQWFLTLFCNCLPQDTVLRVWDLIFLEGNHILLSTALAIWSTLSDRIMTVESADEFYCIMGVLTREMLEFGLMDANALIKAIVSFNLPELPELREKYLYNITPWTQSVSTVARRGLRLFYSDDDTDTEEDDEKIAIATAYGLFRSPKRKEGASGVTSPPRALTCPDKEKIAMDISALTKQYRKLRERQKQAHVILTAACGSQSLVGPTTSPAMNHLLMGKFALVNNKGRRLGPPPGSIPPPSQPRTRPGEKQNITISGETLHWKDTSDGKKPQQRDSDEERSPEPRSRRSSSSSTSTELCDDPQRSPSDSEDLSDASAFLPSDTEPSTPKRSVQPKVQHPLDVISCKEEDEDAFEKPEQEKDAHPVELEVKQKDSNSLSPVSPEGDEEKSQKRKLSFRIDPEEMRQLDRKLSLKIVEIERRKSSAGIDSEDLNSKVLFPFDRDYIHEQEKCDRDTPSSIPDDRMCSTEDYISGFEEETILVPDIITTHRPLGYRMASVEECDESKVNDSYDGSDENVPDVSMADGVVDERLYGDNGSPDEQYEEEEEEEEIQNAYTNYNFDELFINEDSEQDKDGLGERGEIESVNYCEGKVDISENSLKLNHNGRQVTSPLTTSIKLENTNAIKSTSYVLSGIIDSSLSEKMDNSSSSHTNLHLSDDMKANISGSEPTIRGDCFYSAVNYQTSLKDKTSEPHDDSDQKYTEINAYLQRKTLPQNDESFSLPEEEVNGLKTTEHGVTSTTSYNLSDSEKAFEKKLLNVLPKIASLSFDSSMPDVTAVTSRDECINSIREKYANLGQTSREEIEPDSYGSFHFTRSNSKAEANSAAFTDIPIPNFMSMNNNEDISSTSSETTSTISIPTMKEVDHSSSKICKSSETVGMQNNILKQHLDETNIDPELTFYKKDNLQEVDKVKLINKEEPNQQTDGCDDVGRRPSSASSNRRGSEVALSLILKENLQILSKIQQQSRRSSEVNLDQTSTYEKFMKAESPEESLVKSLKTDEEIISLTKAILESEVDSTKPLQPEEPTSGLSPVISRFTPEQRDHHLPETKPIVSSCEMPMNNISKECIEIKKDEVFDKLFENQEILKESSFENRERTDIQSLPDICKFDVDLNQSPKHRNTSSNKYQPYLPPKLISRDIETDINATDHSVKIFKEPYNYSKRPSIMSPTTEVDENSPPEVNSSFKSKLSSGENDPVVSSLKSSEEAKFSVTSTLHQNSSLLKIERNSSGINSLSDTNDDILKELRALNIKPEEVLEYSDPKAIPITPMSPEDRFSVNKVKSPTASISNLSSDKGKHDFQRFPSERSSDFRTPREHVQADYKTSFDAVSSSKTDLYSEERRKPFVRSVSAVDDDDDSLYLSSYKSHGRLLIEKGELDPYRSLNRETSKFETAKCSDRNQQNTDKESAYEYKRVSSSRVNRSYSEFLADDTRSSNPTKTEPREKMLFKYKSEDYGRSMSPPHYRFSSASPVRRRLETLPTESPTSPYSSLARAKSPSPTYYGSSHSLPSRESSLVRSPERLGTDLSYKASTDYKRYSRTESLDLNHSEVRSTYSKKKAESFDTFTSEKVSGEKKSPLSPQKFNPFPVRSSSRQPKELGVKLGLYLPQKSDKSPSKHLT